MKVGNKIPHFEKMYFKLAAKMADAIETLENVSRDLKAAQIESEEMYIASDDEDEKDRT